MNRASPLRVHACEDRDGRCPVEHPRQRPVQRVGLRERGDVRIRVRAGEPVTLHRREEWQVTGEGVDVAGHLGP